MLRMFNTYIKSKMEYCCIVWSPVSQKWIYELEKIQKSFTSKINGMEEFDYHERLKKLNLYSLERRRERFMIIYNVEIVSQQGISFKHFILLQSQGTKRNTYNLSNILFLLQTRWRLSFYYQCHISWCSHYFLSRPTVCNIHSAMSQHEQ